MGIRTSGGGVRGVRGCGGAFADPICGQGFLPPAMTEPVLDEDMMAGRHRPRKRHAAGVTIRDGDPPAVLGYHPDYEEARPINPKLGGLFPSELDYLRPPWTRSGWLPGRQEYRPRPACKRGRRAPAGSRRGGGPPHGRKKIFASRISINFYVKKMT